MHFLAEDADLARRYGHLTVRPAGLIAARAGVRPLVLTHLSQRSLEPARFGQEAAGCSMATWWWRATWTR